MNMMRFAEEQGDNFCVAWLKDGKSFIIRDQDTFTRQVVPKFFKPTKFASFTRKLYRWGFRQINRGIGPDDPIVFGNDFFQRDDASLMTKMRSVTAASFRKTEPSNDMTGAFSSKRPMDVMIAEASNQKRIYLEHMMHLKPGSTLPQHGSYFAGDTMPLSSALRPSFGMTAIGGHKPFDFMNRSAQSSSRILDSYAAPAMQASQHYPSPATTAEIVNAAIAALRYPS